MVTQEKIKTLIEGYGFIETNPKDDEICYQLKDLHPRMHILLFTSLSAEDKQPLKTQGNAFRLAFYDVRTQKIVGKRMKIFQEFNWEDILISKLDRFVSIVKTETWKKCPHCNEPMRWISAKENSFWGCSRYPDCLYKELRDINTN